MSLIAAYFGAAFLQMLFLLGTSHILGPTEYASYSLTMVIATFGTTMIFEPVRMILVRYAGTTRLRFRHALLSTIRRWTDVSVLTVMIITTLVASALIFTHERTLAGGVTAFGIAMAANGLNDSVATYLRFAADERSYIYFTLARAAGGGCTMLGAAAVLQSGSIVLMASSLSVLCIAFIFRARSWPHDASRVNHQLILKFWRYGSSLALNSISVNFAFAASRAGLKLALNKDIAGAVFLALDLAARGASVLGQAISTWSARPVFDAMHTSGKAGALAAFRRTASVFFGAWGSCAVYGGVISLVVPLLVLHVSPSETYRVVSALNILALLAIFPKLHCTDILLSSIDRPQEVAISAIILATVTGLVALCFYKPVSFMAAFSIPIATAVSLAVYWYRNATWFRISISRHDGFYIGFKFLWFLAVALYLGHSISDIILAVTFATTADLLWVYNFRRSRCVAVRR